MFKTYREFNLSQGVKNKSLAVIATPSETFVMLHRTIVVHQKGNKIKISDGGWDTVSTRLVINKALSELTGGKYFLERKKGVTYLRTCNEIYGNISTEIFVSGMKLTI